ncbi:MAG: hypothetical protein K0R54_2988 [Clostridiaceae bacterium]|nr:hypothetical protein [Clostridiaceae bacterium]
MEEEFVIGIDLGGTKICGAIADIKGNVINKYIIPTNANQGEQTVLQRIMSVIDKLIEESGEGLEKIKAIGIGSPGPLDPKKGMIITTPNLPFKNFKLVEPIKNKYNIPTFLDNDANVAAIGEYMLGAGKGTENMVYITVSTGIGGGAIINGKIYRGNTFNALEVGHMTIVPDGPKCNCGNHGCVEALASGTAIGRQAMEHIKNEEDTSLVNYEKVTAAEVFIEAAKGDALSQKILDKSLEYLGIGVANLITILDPEVFVIGGGVSNGGSIVFEKVQQVVNQRCFQVMSENCRIVPAMLGNDAGVIGAVSLAIMEIK